MKPLPFYAINHQQVTTHAAKVIKLESTLKATATAGLFLMVFDTNATPANGAVPIKSWPADECGYKEFKRGELRCAQGCHVALSTTAATLTLAAGANDTLDILQVELTDPETPSGTSIAGVLTTGVTGLEVWKSANGPKRLVRVEVDNTAGNAGFLMLFAQDSPAEGAQPIDQFSVAAGAVLTGASALQFGESGRAVFSKSAAGADQNGCTLVMSSTAGTLTTITGTTTIKAEYK